MPCSGILRYAAIVRTNVSENVSPLRSVLRLLITANVIPSSLNRLTLMMEATLSSETSVISRARRRHIKEDGILREQGYFTALWVSRLRSEHMSEMWAINWKDLEGRSRGLFVYSSFWPDICFEGVRKSGLGVNPDMRSLGRDTRPDPPKYGWRDLSLHHPVHAEWKNISTVYRINDWLGNTNLPFIFTAIFCFDQQVTLASVRKPHLQDYSLLCTEAWLHKGEERWYDFMTIM
jgi:hypothetical protein